MTRREKELLAAAIRYASFANQALDFTREGMTAKARKIVEYLTFEVTDDEIAAAVAVNLAGHGSRTAMPFKGIIHPIGIKPGDGPVAVHNDGTVEKLAADDPRLRPMSEQRDELYRTINETRD